MQYRVVLALYLVKKSCRYYGFVTGGDNYMLYSRNVNFVFFFYFFTAVRKMFITRWFQSKHSHVIETITKEKIRMFSI